MDQRKSKNQYNRLKATKLKKQKDYLNQFEQDDREEALKMLQQ